jgi:hypothetical protein
MHRGCRRVRMLSRRPGISIDKLPGLPTRARRLGVATVAAVAGAAIGLVTPHGAEPFATGTLLAVSALVVGVLSSWSP